MDDILLTIMAYDHFVAICYHLKYMVIMSPQHCTLLVLVSWLIIVSFCMTNILLMKPLILHRGTEILHFFCELAQVFKVASSHTFISNIVLLVAAALLCVFPVIWILFS